jgi:hypothetical protein
MSKKSNFRIGVKYGVIKRILKRVTERKVKQQRKVIYSDLKNADEELLDFLCACTPETLDEFIENINIWLSMEAKMTGYKVTEYTIGQGENIFKKVGIERELFYRNNKKS